MSKGEKFITGVAVLGVSIPFIMVRDIGTPVTLIDKTVYGDEEVAELRYNRDVAEEAINTLKLNMRIVESQINREWGIKK